MKQEQLVDFNFQFDFNCTCAGQEQRVTMVSCYLQRSDAGGRMWVEYEGTLILTEGLCAL